MMKKMNAVPHSVSGGNIEQCLDWYFVINERTGKACYATQDLDNADYVDEQVNPRPRCKPKRNILPTMPPTIPQPRIPYFLDSINDVSLKSINDIR